MSIQHILFAISVALVVGSIGCSEREKPSSFVDRVAADTPVLTSTASSGEVEPTPPASEAVPEEDDVSEEELEATPSVDDAPTFEATIESVDGLTIRRFITSSGIEQREPVGATSSFGPQHDRIYAFVEVGNAGESPKTLMVHFIGPKVEVTGGVELQIPASVPRWRTWAYTKHFEEPGLWRVEIRDDTGFLLGALPFEVEATH